MTNGDKIRSFTDRQIAAMLSHMRCGAEQNGCNDCLKHMGDCVECWLEFVEAEAGEGDQDEP